MLLKSDTFKMRDASSSSIV